MHLHLPGMKPGLPVFTTSLAQAQNVRSPIYVGHGEETRNADSFLWRHLIGVLVNLYIAHRSTPVKGKHSIPGGY
jgi:predicted esterase